MTKWYLAAAVIAVSLLGPTRSAHAQELQPQCQQNVKELCGRVGVGTCFADGALWPLVADECVGDIQTMIEMEREFHAEQNRPASADQPMRMDVLGYSYGGTLRAGPGTNYKKIGSLAEGEQLSGLEDTGVAFDGYNWFRVSTGIGEGYHWGGIFCTEGTSPVRGVFAACNASVVPMTVFSCDTGGKTVSVTSDNNSLTYSYGATGRIEKSITGDARSGNLHWMQMRYAGLVSQLRFSSGEYSYILFHAEGNANTGAQTHSGLVVMQGTRVISEKTCTSPTAFSPSFDYDALPRDSERYSAM
ncbi:SH3 domain-containing protein [Puniceibacterium confluentis]|uniref:SH3 domain-containing protein n=1 Tax=Puniceibacterium confluentis TaxID=1958944 RepID=UPI0011B6B5EB|nr:SH3 domain-containing protein [Puniceibacterium confluentis]